MRPCRVCHAEKPATAFYGRSTECKVCHLARKKAEYAADPEKFKARTRLYQARYPERVRESRRKSNGTPIATARARRGHLKKHGIGEEQFDDLFISQGERCAICNQAEPGRYWCLDHDHACCSGPTSCGKCIRGILCWHCNVALGHFRDNAETLRSAISYLTGGESGHDTQAVA